LETCVAKIMTRKVVFCSRHDKLVDLMQRMTDGKFRHLPVIEDGRLIGIVSIGDVVKSRLEELQRKRFSDPTALTHLLQFPNFLSGRACVRH
jgi:predicted transcriptional regulator